MSDTREPVATIDTSRFGASPALLRLFADLIDNFAALGGSVEPGTGYDRSTVYLFANRAEDEPDLDELRARLAGSEA
jgi:hypothetical protein